MSARSEDASLVMAWTEAPWDGDVIGAPALQISQCEVRGPSPGVGMQAFERERDRLGVAFVSCRLPHDRLIESMLLEDHGFRFVEMLYRPEVELGAAMLGDDMAQLSVTLADRRDLPELLDIAGSAFGNERFHMDPRLGAAMGDQRYRNWVSSSLRHPAQRLFTIRAGTTIVALFITEMLGDGLCYWHLTAVAPAAQGGGTGRRVWRAMMEHAAQAGATRVRTSVAARNYRVINLYAQLGFRFSAPLMTFHWVRESVK